MIKKVILMVLMLSMMCTVLNLDILTYANGGAESNLIFDEATGTITGYTGEPVSIDIPDKINGVTVTAIRNEAFAYCESLQSISLPDSVTTIGTYAFLFCESLQTVSLPDSVTYIGGGAFFFCESLSSISLPDGVTAIEGATFAYCKSLRSISLPDSVVSIGGTAFAGCISLKSIVIPDGVTTIKTATFSMCEGLTSVILPNTVTFIEEYAFANCESLESIIIPDKVTTIAIQAFQECKSLKSVTIPKSVRNIGLWAFGYCDNLKTIYYTGTETEWESLNIGSWWGDISYLSVEIVCVPERIVTWVEPTLELGENAIPYGFAGGISYVSNTGADQRDSCFVTTDGEILEHSDELYDIWNIANQINYCERENLSVPNLFCIEREGRYGYKNAEGELIIPYKYWDANSFSEGRALVNSGEIIEYDGGGGLAYAYIDETGTPVTQFIYDGNSRSFAQGLARVRILGENKYGYIDKNGNTVIPFIYDEAGDFSQEGLACVRIDGKYGYINKSGIVVISPIYTIANPFSDGRAWVMNEEWKFGCIDKSGNIIVPFIYDSLGSSDLYNFHEGFAFAKKEEKVGYIDFEGRDVVPFIYDFGYPFTNGIAMVCNADDKIGYVDVNGNEIVPCVYQNFLPNPYTSKYAAFNEGYAWVKLDGKFGILKDTHYKSSYLPVGSVLRPKNLSSKNAKISTIQFLESELPDNISLRADFEKLAPGTRFILAVYDDSSKLTNLYTDVANDDSLWVLTISDIPKTELERNVKIMIWDSTMEPIIEPII